MIEPTVTRRRRTSFPGGVSSYGEDRVCATDECGTKLSRYNDGERCSSHDGQRRRT